MRALVHAPSAPRRAARKIGRAEKVGVLLQASGKLLPAKCVVAQGDYVSPGLVEPLHLLGRYADNRGVLPVDDCKVDILELFQGAQMTRQMIQPLLAHHVAYC